MPEETPQPSQSRTAVWFNKRELSRVDLPVTHTLTSHNDGWRIDFGGAGRIRTIGAPGHNLHLDVVQGDFLLSSGEDFYLSLATPPADEAKEARSQAKQEGREGGGTGGGTGGSGGGTGGGGA